MRVAPFVLATAFLLAAPGAASADVIFDPADADELAAILAEATQTQDVCYGWRVTVNDVGAVSESVGSSAGAGTPVTSGTCADTVEFTANITYTSESSESEDSASYDLVSSPGGPTRADLDALGIDFGELTGENPDVVVAKAVTALPLLAADAGLAEPIEAAPETGTAPADAQLTDDPGSDWWRSNGTELQWAGILIAASLIFAWWVVRSNRRKRRPLNKRAKVAPVRDEPPTDEFPAQEPSTAEEEPVAEKSTVDEPASPEPGGTDSGPDSTGPDQAPPAPPVQKDKE